MSFLRKPIQARALQVFRRAAGFRSAEAAAAKFGWPLSRYRSHESGTRMFRSDDIAAYASAFGVAPDQIGHPSEHIVEMLDLQDRDMSRRLRMGSAGRLRALRSMAGYNSAAAFCRRWKLVQGTYIKHEGGQNVLAGPALALYSAIHGVREEWLATGELPSGLGDDIDGRIDDLIRSPTELRERSTMSADRGTIDRLRASLEPGRPSVLGDRTIVVSEFVWTDLEEAGGRIGDCCRRTAWGIPIRLFADDRTRRRDCFVVAADRAVGDVMIGERLFLIQAGTKVVSGACLYFSDGMLHVSETKRPGIVVGLIIGRLRLPI